LINEIDPEKFINEIYRCEPKDVAKTVILTPGRKFLDGLKEKVDVEKEFKGFLEGFTGRYGGKPVTVIMTLVGSPVSSDAAYFLRFTPCKNIIYTGAVGALKENIEIGDIIVPTGAVRGEGASKYHAKEWYPAVASFELLRTADPILEEAFSRLGVNVHYGIIYTTDSFAAETREFLGNLAKMNIIGIEMKTSDIFTIANLQGKHVVAIHVVSDNPIVGKSLVEPLPAEDKNRRDKSTEVLPEVILRIAGEM